MYIYNIVALVVVSIIFLFSDNSNAKIITAIGFLLNLSAFLFNNFKFPALYHGV